MIEGLGRKSNLYCLINYQPLLSDKLSHKEKINLSENWETDMEIWTFWTLSSRMFFKILTFRDSDSLIQNLKDATLKAILKYKKKHPSINDIESK